ncbi:Uncharacterized conserved protein, DUF885 familyt [Duganella sacchari]|uniref:Uncharacterized conserved protein, DUF885 familyt n=1 Tax=Duganella sacchari TaxID=551987 RepID=A0A1M7MXX8_9BURK|nr:MULTISPECIES: DUF885 domain-containing protein [Duganella]MYM29507.1 DUF885 family protein [Duganella sp. CY15W]SHM96064.1 Uncharacterized conserved protein, DUF885 familyt [Duganella sacchari]
MTTTTRIGAASALLFSLILGVAHADTAAPDLEARRTALNSLLKEQWEYTMRSSPEWASLLGDKRYNDKWSDFSQAGIEADLKASADFLKRFEAVDTTGFPLQEQLNRELMVRQLRQNLDGARFKDWEMPLAQNSGIHIDGPMIISALNFETVKDYEDYIKRLHALPKLFEETRVQMDKGVKDGLMPPKFLIPKIVKQCEDVAAMKPADSPYAEPLKKMPKDFSAADKERLTKEILAAVKTDVAPAYKKLAVYTKTKYLPHGRTEVGMWSLPDGVARYNFKAQSSTTTEMSAEQIHQLGLSEVARIEGQMLETAKKLGYKDLKSFNKAVEANPALHPKSRQEIIDLYQKYTDQMYTQLSNQFGVLPKNKVEIKPVEEFREKGASAAAYMPGSPDGKRPGRVMVNTGDFAKRSTIDIETTALHEGVPGHHMQLTIAQEIQGLPDFRQQGNYTAYAEGWALYSERLGEELGFYKDPYSYYGHLQDEMLRAIRLVVDTGLHYKKWNRQQVVDFFHAHSGIGEVEVQSETDRYIVWPGQALGYKIGQLKILELRDYARKELGDRFDIRKFHDQVLGAGALPMDVLESHIKDWVATEKKTVANQSS